MVRKNDARLRTEFEHPGRRPPPRLDDLDRRLLGHLQDDARVTTAELARRFDLSAPGLQKRLRRLEEKGVIQQFFDNLNMIRRRQSQLKQLERREEELLEQKRLQDNDKGHPGG